ncbi:hypothetical protein ACJ6WF_39575 [Streptomyces sp. MMS24-I2-30]
MLVEAGTDVLVEVGAAVVPLPGCGHTIMLDIPRALVRATADALGDRAAG